MRNKLSMLGNRNGSARECALRNAGTQDVKGVAELLILPTQGEGQEAVGTLVQKMSSRCFCFRFITHSVHR